MKEMNVRVGEGTHDRLHQYAKTSRRSKADIINEALCDWLDVAPDAAPREIDVESFWTRSSKAKGKGCWTWREGTDKFGYGRVHGESYGLTTTLAHRVAWVLAGNADAGDLCVLHRCDNPPCVRPDHLFLGTRADNSADMMGKGRHRTTDDPKHFTQGSRNPKSKLTEDQVVELRKRAIAGEHYIALAEAFGITPSRANAIILGNGWRHIWPYFEARSSDLRRQRLQQRQVLTGRKPPKYRG